jgi:preprotein translocase subunit SecY
MILFMDDVMTKWGFGSGVSLFIAAGVSKALIVKAFNFLPPPNASGELAVGASGKIPQLIQQLAEGHPEVAFPIIIMLIATAAVFAIAVFGQAMKVEIPLSFGRVRGFGIRWPLQFIYTSNIPVILISALIANVQLLARMSEKFVTSNSFSGKIVAGLVAWLTPPNMVESVFRKTLTLTTFGQALFYLLFMVAGSIIFSIFWVQTSGMDARAQAKNIISSGLQIPGFRRDERVLEHILNRYIWPLTVMGAIFVGLLAGLADISGALVHGTSLLLTVMIIYKLYEDIASQHLYDMNPALRKFME